MGQYIKGKKPGEWRGVFLVGRAREYVVALRWLGWMLERRKRDVQLLCKIGYVQLVLGDLRAAAASFQDVIKAVAALGPEATPPDRRLVRRNQGLLLFAEQDYKGTPAAPAPIHLCPHCQICSWRTNV